MNLATLIARIRGWLAGRSLKRAVRDPESAQRLILTNIIGANRDTAFGQAHRFSEVDSYEDFRDGVPVRDFEGHRTYVNQIVNGDLHALTAEDPFMLGSTSGTTSEPKWVPVTETWREQMAGLLRYWIAQATWAHPRMLMGKVLTIVSPAIEGYAPSGLPIGSVSGLTSSRVPWVIRRQYAIPYEVSTIADYDVRYYVIARFAFESKVSTAVTPNPSTLIRLAAVGAENAQRIIDSIRSGRLGVDIATASPADQECLSLLEGMLKPNPRRANQLQAILDQRGRLIPKDVWPSLAMIGCWLGGSAGVHARSLHHDFGPVPLRDLGFRATEGTFTVPLEDGTPSGVLAVNANFYEFIPEEEMDSDTPTYLLAHELEVGCTYYIIVTTNSGLYRYDINDVVEVTGWHERAPKIRFLRKGRDMVSIVGEKLHVNQALAAAEDARKQTDVDWARFQLIPDAEASRYDLLIEPATAEVTDDELKMFVHAFDAALMVHNPEYPTKRDSNRLDLPRLHRMKIGWSEAYRLRQVSRGKRDVQFKWPYVRDAWEDADRAFIAGQDAPS